MNDLLSTTRIYDIQHNFAISTANGWKLSIQGKSIDDSAFLYNRLTSYLEANAIPYKVGTAKRMALTGNPSRIEQSHKCMTVYCPDSMNIMDLAEEVYSRIMDYKGWHNISTPTSYQHYAGGVFYRNDRDQAGKYIPAN